MNPETVFLLHGLAAHRILLIRLAKSLRDDGFNVVNWGYRSLWSPIERHSDALIRDISRFVTHHPTARVHIVGHSMGSIIARAALSPPSRLHTDKQLGRVVMLGPPNLGSHVARVLASPFGWLCPPLSQLSDEPNSFVNRLPEFRGREIGVIAAESDFVVARSSTHLMHQSDWLLLPGHHSELLWRRETGEHVSAFLRTGRFRKQA